MIYALQKAIEDEETRKNLMYIIMIPVIFITLLTSMIYYMFTMPLNTLGD